MQIWIRKIKDKKPLKNWIWDGFGLHLGGGWDALGRLLASLGRLLAVFGTFKIELFSNMGPRWPPRGLLGRLWVDLGSISGGFWRAWGRFGVDFEWLQCLLELSWGEFGNSWHDLVLLGQNLLIGPPR